MDRRSVGRYRPGDRDLLLPPKVRQRDRETMMGVAGETREIMKRLGVAPEALEAPEAEESVA